MNDNTPSWMNNLASYDNPSTLGWTSGYEGTERSSPLVGGSSLCRWENLQNIFVHVRIYNVAGCIQPSHEDEPHSDRGRRESIRHTLRHYHLFHRWSQRLLQVTQLPNRLPWLWLQERQRTRTIGHGWDSCLQEPVPQRILVLQGWCQCGVWVPNRKQLRSRLLSLRIDYPRSCAGSQSLVTSLPEGLESVHSPSP